MINYLFHALARALASLPLPLLHRFGAALGKMVLRIDRRYREQVRGNLLQAGLLTPENEQASAAEAGKGALELAYVWLRPPGELLSRTEARNWHLVEQARAAGRGIVFLTPHLGCFEITAQHYADNRRDGAPITVLYRKPRKAWLQPLVELGRGRPNLDLATADLRGVRKLVRALRRGEAVGLLPDQVPSQGEGVWAPFFGKPAYTMTLPARLHELTGATILLAHGERLAEGAGWVVHIHPFTPTLAGDAQAKSGQVNAALEDVIRLCPQQYIWGYNRYKIPAGVTAPAPVTAGEAA